MSQPIEVTGNCYVSEHATVTMLCEDMRKMHERLMNASENYALLAKAEESKLSLAEMGGHIEES